MCQFGPLWCVCCLVVWSPTNSKDFLFYSLSSLSFHSSSTVWHILQKQWQQLLIWPFHTTSSRQATYGEDTIICQKKKLCVNWFIQKLSQFSQSNQGLRSQHMLKNVWLFLHQPDSGVCLFLFFLAFPVFHFSTEVQCLGKVMIAFDLFLI